MNLFVSSLSVDVAVWQIWVPNRSICCLLAPSAQQRPICIHNIIIFKISALQALHPSQSGSEGSSTDPLLNPPTTWPHTDQ